MFCVDKHTYLSTTLQMNSQQQQLMANPLWIMYYKLIDMHDFNSQASYSSDGNRSDPRLFRWGNGDDCECWDNFIYRKWHTISLSERETMVKKLSAVLSPYYFDIVTSYFTRTKLLNPKERLELRDCFIVYDSYWRNKEECICNFIDFITIYGLIQSATNTVVADAELFAICPYDAPVKMQQILEPVPDFLSDMYYLTMPQNKVVQIYEWVMSRRMQGLLGRICMHE